MVYKKNCLWTLQTLHADFLTLISPIRAIIYQLSTYSLYTSVNLLKVYIEEHIAIVFRTLWVVIC